MKKILIVITLLIGASHAAIAMDTPRFAYTRDKYEPGSLNDLLLRATKEKEPNHSTIKYLLEQGADVDCTDRLGNTPLILVSRIGKLDSREAMQVLLKAGANPNHISSTGKTALMCAVNCEEKTKMLIAAGADVLQINPARQIGLPAGLTAVETAERRNYSSLQILKEKALEAEECIICARVHTMNMQTPCCKQSICRTCWDTPVKTGDKEIQNGEFAGMILEHGKTKKQQECPFCREVQKK